MIMQPLRYWTRPVRGLRNRWQVWDRATNKAFAPYHYRSVHKCNKAVDRLNGMSNREGALYRAAKNGEHNHG